MGQYLTDLPEERLAKYRLMAAHAHESARAAESPEARNAFIAIASSWDSLAEEMERVLEARDVDPDATLPLTKALNPPR